MKGAVLTEKPMLLPAALENKPGVYLGIGELFSPVADTILF